MHVRREARLVDDHRYGVELSLAPTPVKSSQKNRPDAPYEGLPPNRWMPGTNAKCPRTPVRGVFIQGMIGGMAEKGNPAASEAGMAVLAAVRGLREDLMAAQEAQQAGDDPMGFALVLGSVGRAAQWDWSPLVQYQAIALLGAMVQALSNVTGKSEEDILTDLESNYH
jgi:hypothetical protein